MNRVRNLCTLGDNCLRRNLINRREPDVFERDPFKVQSFKFRYAERPVHSLQRIVGLPLRPSLERRNRVSAASTSKVCETFYRNTNFSSCSIKQAEPQPREEPKTNVNSFLEHRRRKFLQGIQASDLRQPAREPESTVLAAQFKRENSALVTPQPRHCAGLASIFQSNAAAAAAAVPTTVTNSPLLRRCCTRGEYLIGTRSSNSNCRVQPTSSTNVLSRTNSCKRLPAGLTATATATATETAATKRQTRGRSVSATSFLVTQQQAETQTSTPPQQRRSSAQLHSFKLGPKRSSCSGCEININIAPMSGDADAESMHIKIETDGCLVNNMDNKLRLRTGKQLQARRSLDTLGIDKRLSKFALDTGRNSEAQEANRQRLRAQLARERELFGNQQLEQAIERQRARERELARQRLREEEREKDRQHLLSMERERERQRLLQLELEQKQQWQQQQKCAQYHSQHWYAVMPPAGRSLPAVSPRSPTPSRPPVATAQVARCVNTKISPQPCRQMSPERVPSMMPYRLRPPQSALKRAPASNSNASSNASKAGNRNNSSRRSQRLQNLQKMCKQPNFVPPQSPNGCTLERCSSGTSNANANVSMRSNSNGSMRRRQSAAHEVKLLNVQLRRQAPAQNRHKSRPFDDIVVPLSTGQARVRQNSPAPRCYNATPMNPADIAASLPYSFNINVYADTLRMLRI